MNEITYIGKHQLTMNVPYHMHDTWEFIYCTGGSGCLEFKDRKLNYEKGDVVIIPPQCVHCNHSFEGFTNIHINMKDASLSFKEPLSIKDDANAHIFEAFNSIHYHYYSNIKQKSLIVSALGMLIVSYFIVHQENSDVSTIVQKIEANILDNFADCYYDLNEYLKSFHFNNDYIRKLFKNELGVTPNQYLIEKRLQTSADLLKSLQHDSNNISGISVMCGFRDPLYFSRMFKKKYGMSPSEYAREYGIGKEEETSDDQKIFLSEK